MCHLVVLPGGVKANVKHLRNAAHLNRHGHGWAVATPGHMWRGKSLNADAEIDLFAMFREEFPGAPAMFHSRFASATPADLDGCHPFEVGHDPGVLMAHNGYLFTSPDGRSDSRVFAEDILPCWDIADKRQRAELEALIAPSRAVILRAGAEPVILNEQLGLWLADGSWHSNRDFTGFPIVPAGTCRVCRMVPSLTAVCETCTAAAESRRLRLTGGDDL